MTDPLEDLLAAADHGVDCDGLVLERAGAEYRLETPDGDRAELASEEVRATLADHDAAVSNWAHWRSVASIHPAAEPFCRWCEHAASVESLEARLAGLEAGVERTWGQLLIRTTLTGTAGRVHELRHVSDSELPRSELEALDSPRNLRDLARRDDRGRHRPLKSAPTLVAGWVLPALEPAGLLEAIRHCYPASVENWHRERSGELDVDHWRETAARQSGMYSLLSDLSPEAVGWLASACCVDGACCKRRVWDYADDDPLDVPRGEGAIPCREPCPFALALARQVAITEGETERTRTASLTLSEVNQLEAIVRGAVDDDLEERPGAVGSPTNRHRIRYLLAKRFSDGGPFLEED